MTRATKAAWTALSLVALFLQGGCGAAHEGRMPPQEHNVKIVSDAQFVRTRGGEHLDGYFAEYRVRFEKKRMFMAFDITRYDKGEWLTVTGRFANDHVQMPLGDGGAVDVPVFHVRRAAPVVWRDPVILR